MNAAGSIALGLALLLVSSCGPVYSPHIQSTHTKTGQHEPDRSYGYVYGRLNVDNDGFALPISELVLVVDSTDETTHYLLDFIAYDKVSVFELIPNEYGVLRVMYPRFVPQTPKSYYRLEPVRMPDEKGDWPYSIPFNVEPNNIYYIGDITYMWCGIGSGPDCNEFNRYYFGSVADNYDDATRELIKSFPGFSDMPRHKIEFTPTE